VKVKKTQSPAGFKIKVYSSLMQGLDLDLRWVAAKKTFPESGNVVCLRALLSFGFFQYRLKQMRIFGGKLRKNFAVNGDIVGFHRVDEAAVGDAVLPAERVNVDVPQGSRFAFFDFAVAIIIA